MTRPTIEVTNIFRARAGSFWALQGHPQLSAAEGISSCVATRNLTRKCPLKFHIYIYRDRDRGKRLRLPSCLLIETDSTDALSHPAVSCSSRFRCRLATIHPECRKLHARLVDERFQTEHCYLLSFRTA